MTTQEITAADTGCYVDGHWGNYALSRMLQVADDILGTDFYEQAAAAYAETPTISYDPETRTYSDGPLPTEPWDGFTFETLPDIADEAEQALNDATPNQLIWHWFDGEFFLSPNCYSDDPDTCENQDCYCHA